MKLIAVRHVPEFVPARTKRRDFQSLTGQLAERFLVVASNRLRRLIVNHLAAVGKADYGANIAKVVGYSQMAVHYQLQILKQDGIVQSIRTGVEIQFALADSQATEILERLAGVFA